MFICEGRLPSHGNAFTWGLCELNLEQNCDLMSNSRVAAFSKRCSNLVKLNLSYCRLSSEGMSFSFIMLIGAWHGIRVFFPSISLT